MTSAFAYIGSSQVETSVIARLEEAGYIRTTDVHCADIVFTHALNQSQLEDIYFDDNGLIQQAKPGTLLVDLSSTTPSFARELNAVATVSDLFAVEAPLVLEDMFAVDALSNRENVTILLGGDQDALSQVMEYAEVLAHRVEVCGAAGSAELAKAAFTIQKAACVISAIESQALYRAVRHSAGAGGGEEAGPVPVSDDAACALRALDAESFGSEYTLMMFMADVAAALESADDADLILPQAESCLHLLELLMVIGGMDMSVSALSLLYADEKVCAEHGLDWTRAEEAFSNPYADSDDDDYLNFSDEDDYDGYPDDEDGGYFGYPGFPGYSEN